MTETPNNSGSFGSDENDAISLRVVDRVSQVTGTDPTELQPLYETVDPDYLDELFTDGPDSRRRRDGHVSFTIEGCEVVVSADGTIDVSPEETDQNAPDVGTGTDRTAEASESTD